MVFRCIATCSWRASTLAIGLFFALATGNAAERGEARDGVASSPRHALTDRPTLDRLAQGSMRKFRFHEAPRPLPDIVLASASPPGHALSRWRGRTVLLNVWASWCAPCRDELPVLDRMAHQLEPDGIAVVGLSIDKQPSEAIAFMERLGLDNLPLYLDPTFDAARALGVSGAPTSILIDPSGRELGRIEGAVDWSATESRLLLKAMALRSSDVPPSAPHTSRD